MKKSIFTLLIVLISINLAAQTRQNREKIKFEKESDLIKSATGWSYNSTIGEWVDYENVISNDKKYKTEFKSLQGEYMKSHTKQNFISIQTKKTFLDSIPYYVIIIEKYGGGYEYPKIKRDWKTWKEIVGYIYTQDEYNKIISFDETVELKTKNIVSLGINKPYDEQLILDKVQTELKKEISKYSPEYIFPLKLTKSDDQKVLRFYLPTYFSRYNKYDFEKEYFEIKPELIKKIIIE